MALLTKEAQDKVINLLVNEGLANVNSVAQVINEVAQTKQPLIPTLISKGVINDEMMVHATAVTLGVGYVDLRNVEMDQDTLTLLPLDVAERSMVVPLGENNGQLTIAMLDVGNLQALDYLSTLTGKSVRGVMASNASIMAVLQQYKGDFTDIHQAVKATNKEVAQTQSSNVKTITQDSPISKALTSILEYAVKSKASDVHIEPLENGLIIRCRIDGVLRKVMELPKAIEPALVSRIKILANLKIDEHRIPQDGQFAVLVGDKEVDLRIAISPVVWGEQVVIRLLDKSGTTMDVEKMGMTGHALRTVLNGISKPNGMILTSGPTGSGKSTTLAALIDKINSEKAVHIITIEDPIEFTHQSKRSVVAQREVHYDTYSFAVALKSVLREDPDVVLVGELRDLETIQAAVTLAETGHLVFATLHTNSAAQSVDRLIDVFPAHQQSQIRTQLASILMAICSQRLVPAIEGGRIAVTEVLIANSAVRAIIREGKTHQLDMVIQTSADQGMQTMDRELVKHVKGGSISYDTAREFAVDLAEFDRLAKG